jgi:hypothetical protein
MVDEENDLKDMEKGPVIRRMQTQKGKTWFATSFYDCFLVERDILQLTI